MSADPDLPSEAFAAAIAGLPDVGPARLHRLLSGGEPIAVWRAICEGATLPATVSVDSWERSSRGPRAITVELREQWRRSALAVDVAALWSTYSDAGVTVLTVGHSEYPEPLLGDHQRPAVLFRQGNRPQAAPTVAIVGTRKCTSYGHAVASELGKGLTSAGVVVVSGLAHGIDAAAHAGAVTSIRLSEGSPPVGDSARGGTHDHDDGLQCGETGPLGVVGTGLDHPYPSRNTSLWNEVRRTGTLLSEAPFGAGGAPWRFPARNRIIAALSQVVVVVESGRAGGSMHTVRQADVRNRALMAVPGPITSAASSGTNALIADGVAPCLGVDDVLVAVGLSGHPHLERGPEVDAAAVDPSIGQMRALLDDGPVTYDQLADGLGLGVGAVMALVQRSVAVGAAVDAGGMVSATTTFMGDR